VIRRSRCRAAIGASLLVSIATASCGGSGGRPSTGVLAETGSMAESSSSAFWLNSGGEFFFAGGFGHTIEGDLPASDPWHRAYALSSGIDTDGGSHPQSLFRLVTRQTFQNVDQDLTFTILRDNLSASPNRNQSNGVLLFQRYQDGDNLYYAGVRVDGAAVVKKKLGGTYHTLGLAMVYPGAYDRARAPNLIPEGRPINLHTNTRTNSDQSVDVIVSVDGNVVLRAHDAGTGGAPILNGGFAGIRTDFMDVDFESYRAGGQ
jgi:hypothetical protein